MMRWWMGTALVAWWLGAVTATQAQSVPAPNPSAAGAEPLPTAPSTTPVQGYPAPFYQAPPGSALPGPFRDLELPANIPNASAHPLPPDEGLYIGIGTQALRRDKLGKIPYVILDPQTRDTGAPPRTRFAQPIQHFSDVNPSLVWGPRVTAGYYWGGQAFEFSGYYLPETDTGLEIRNPGRLDLPFINPPLGFEGNNGLWVQADRVNTTFNTRLGNMELNYRCGTEQVTAWPELIFGVRYLDYKEKLSIFTDDDGLTVVDADLLPDAARQAIYTVQTRTRMIAPQLGFEWRCEICPWLTVGASTKGAWGLNFAEADLLLQRGDGLVGRSASRANRLYSSLYEIGAMMDVSPWECLRIRGGYNVMWLLHVPEANSQIDFNLANTQGVRSDNGNIFFRGPQLELQFIFQF